MTMDIEKNLEPLERYLPMEKLLKIVSAPTQVMPEPIMAVLPSITLAGDGPVLTGLLLVSKSCICDTQIQLAEGRSDFDIIGKSSIRDYRFTLWNYEFKEGEVIKASYELANITLAHNLNNLHTKLTYAGNDRSGWLKQVAEAIPIRLVF
jgi:hypothetical protein